MMNLLTHALLPVLLTVAAGPGDAPDYYPLREGTEWAYRAEVEGRTRRMSFRVVKEEVVGGERLSRLETRWDGRVIGTFQLGRSDRGVFRHRFGETAFEPPYCLLKFPVKAGETWEADTTFGQDKIHAVCRVGKEEEVSTPA